MGGCSCYLQGQGRPQEENFRSKEDQQVGFGHVHFEMIFQHARGDMKQAFGCIGMIRKQSRGLRSPFQVQENT